MSTESAAPCFTSLPLSWCDHLSAILVNQGSDPTVPYQVPRRVPRPTIPRNWRLLVVLVSCVQPQVEATVYALMPCARVSGWSRGLATTLLVTGACPDPVWETVSISCPPAPAASVFPIRIPFWRPHDTAQNQESPHACSARRGTAC